MKLQSSVASGAHPRAARPERQALATASACRSGVRWLAALGAAVLLAACGQKGALKLPAPPAPLAPLAAIQATTPALPATAASLPTTLPATR